MANKKISELATGTAPDGTELLESVQGGANVKLTIVQATAINSVSASTAASTITLDFASWSHRIFIGSASFNGPKTIALSNTTNAKKFDFIFTINNTSAITFPAAFIMNDVRWNTSSQEWTPDQSGTYKATAVYDGTNWILDISTAPYS